MLGQLKLSTDGQLLDKVEMAIKRLQAFCPEEGYYVAFSGGKDSQCAYHLCEMAGVKFDAHYCVTSIDPPELVRFIKKNYPDVKFENMMQRIASRALTLQSWFISFSGNILMSKGRYHAMRIPGNR